MSYRYRVVDVFTSTPLEGNPLAVFSDVARLGGEMMQKIARELNLSETTFLLPTARPDCAARVRIFTPAREMEFAGHPTIGSAWVLLDEGKVTEKRFLLDERIGAVPIRVEDGFVWLTTPAIEELGVRENAESAFGLAASDRLGPPAEVVSAGNPCLFLAVRDKEAVDRAYPVGVLESLCYYVFTPTAEGAYSRMFAPELGVVEDPATGSAAGPLASYMMKHGLMPSADGTRIVVEQGVKMGRRSRMCVLVNGHAIEVGGQVTPVIEGTVTIG